MKNDKFLSAMGQTDEKYLEEYEKAKKVRKRNLIIKMTAIAASVCLVIGATAIAIPFISNLGDGTPGQELTQTEATEAPISIDADEPAEEPEKPFTMISVKAEKMNGEFVACDSDFIVEAENATPDKVREHLYISGGPEYTVTEEEDGTFRVSLQSKLSSANVVNLSYANNGVTEYSWAFETERKLQINSHLPGDGEYEVDTTSVIELELSLATDSSIEDYVTFSPSLEGSWETIGKKHRFIPSELLAEDSVYTVSIEPGYSYESYTMEDKYTFSFSTGDYESTKKADSPSRDGILYYLPTESPIIRFRVNSDTPEIVRAEAYTFSNAQDMVKYVCGDTDVPTAYHSSPDFTYSSKAKEHVNGSAFVTLSPMESGYYLIALYDDYSTIPAVSTVVEINPISAYVSATERDILVWTETPDLKVSYGDVSTVTDENGIALLDEATDGSEVNGYVYLGDENPLVLAVPNFPTDSYPGGYIYTDKPIYKTDDTVKFFGTIPTELFYDEIDGAFTVKLERWDETVTESIIVTPDENGAYEGELSFRDMEETDAQYIRLYYNGKIIAARYFSISDYYLQNYLYELAPEKMYVCYGDSLELDVKVTHISGVTVAGKSLRARVDNESYYATTDENGTAHFSIPCPEQKDYSEGDVFGRYNSNYYSQITYETVYIYSGDTEEGSASYDSIAYADFFALYAESDFNYTSNNNDIRFYSNYIDPEKAAGAADSTLITDFFVKGAPFSGEFELVLTTHTREKIGTKVNEYTGRQYTVYSDTVSTEEVLSTENVTDVTEYIIQKGDYSLDAPDELTYYSLNLEYLVTGHDGAKEAGSIPVLSNSYTSSEGFDANSDILGYCTTSGDTYDSYRYSLELSETSVSEGQNVNIRLYDEVNKTYPEDGELLLITYKNGVIENKLLSVSEASFVYDEEYGPLAEVTAAYRKDGKYYRMPQYNISQKIEERTVTVTTETDKESYAPGETVTLTVNTADHTGAPISCTVNLSVVNEAIFIGREHSTNILTKMITSNAGMYPLYTFSTYFDSELAPFMGGLGGGGGEAPRIDFADTACFQNVVTDENGTATVTFTLPDSVTSYRITAHAARGDMSYGVSKSNFNVNMDFFLQSSAPRGQKSTDDYVVAANTVSNITGTVEFTFTVKELDTTLTATADVGSSASVNFGKLAVGTYTMSITAVCGEYTDAVEYPFEVVVGTMYDAYTEELTADEELVFTPSSYPAKIELYTPATERYLKFFDYLSALPTTRMDAYLSSCLGDKLYNSLMNTENSAKKISIPDEWIKSAGLCMYDHSDADTVLTALSVYFGAYNISYDMMETPVSADEYIRHLMLQAAMGQSVLHDLKIAESVAEDDEELTAIIGVSYTMLGDYDSAKLMYDKLPENSDVRGADALRALLATFVDKETAGEYISTLIEEDDDEFYLGFAVLSYLNNRVDYLNEEYTFTLTVNGKSEEHTVSGIEIKTIAVTSDGSDSVAVTLSGENAYGRVTYNDYERNESENDFEVYIEGDITKYGTVYMVFDADSIRGRKTYDIALPPSLRVCDDILYTENVYGTIKHERITMVFTEDCSGAVYLPLLVTQEGNYTVEPIRLTDENGDTYYSNEIVFDAEK